MSYWGLEAAAYGFGLDSYSALPYTGLEYYGSTDTTALPYTSLQYGLCDSIFWLYTSIQVEVVFWIAGKACFNP
ncbi:hypothetical protein BpHYR1_000529 [Brachionus plicatilis]|uniref:Uncharacterized protein n=1 Tax=Brachionus plicatilis TaxID=10195 RepID=A0A3M7R4M0_BRAPC|nr:hypothetical protein BpHYR1_000529 [Brachionus plicatilis]